MKKKILLVVAALMMFMGVVSASSINGDFDGHPIIKIVSNGIAIETGMVPGLIYEDYPMVPVSVLSEVGMKVNFNDTDKTLDIGLPDGSKGISINALMKAFGPNGKSHLLNYVEYMVNGDGYTQLNLYPTFIFWDKDRSEDFHNLLLIAGGVDAQVIRVEDQGNTISFINSADVISFYRGELTSDVFASKIKFVDKIAPVPPVQSSMPVATNDVIESKIEDEFNGFDGETIFKLANGQIWQQDDYQYSYHYAYRPDVTIYKDGSSYKMIVEGMDEKVKVKRLK